jgi:hypothetical protein
MTKTESFSRHAAAAITAGDMSSSLEDDYALVMQQQPEASVTAGAAACQSRLRQHASHGWCRDVEQPGG